MNSSDQNQCKSNNPNSDEDLLSIRNLCSWLLIFTPQELAIIVPILAILITQPLTLAEQAVVGTFLVALSDSILLISAQQLLIDAAKAEQEQLIEKEKEKIAQQKEAQQQAIDQIEQELKDKEIEDLKAKVEKLEELLNKHLKNSL